MTDKSTDTRKGKLMYNLIYPAFLGSTFLWFFSSIAYQYSERPNDIFRTIENYYGLWFIVYFCASYFLMTNYYIGRKYLILVFIIDCIEVIVIFLAFLFLGQVVKEVESQLNRVYGLISFIALFSIASNHYMNHPIRLKLVFATILCTIPMAIWGYELPILNCLSLIYLSIILYFYMKTYTNKRIEIE